MNKLVAGVAVTVVGALAGASGAVAASAATTGTTRSAAVSAQDISWMRNNDQTDLAEIKISQLALRRAEHRDTRATARVTYANHETALRDLRSLARALGVSLPAEPNAMERAQAAKLAVIPAGRFDRRWDTDQIAGHELSVAQTRVEIANGTNPAVVRFARYYLPIAEKHLHMVRADLRQLNIDHWRK